MISKITDKTDLELISCQKLAVRDALFNKDEK